MFVLQTNTWTRKQQQYNITQLNTTGHTHNPTYIHPNLHTPTLTQLVYGARKSRRASQVALPGWGEAKPPTKTAPHTGCDHAKGSEQELRVGGAV